MPSNRRPQPRLAINYDVLVGATIENVTSGQLGIWLRGVAWVVNAGRDWIPQGVLQMYASDDPDYDHTPDLQALVEAELFERCEEKPRLYRLGNLGKTLIVPVRQTVPTTVRIAVMNRDGHRCRRCPSTKKLTIDHITPVSRGGSNNPDNLQVLCSSCNSSKGARV